MSLQAWKNTMKLQRYKQNLKPVYKPFNHQMEAFEAIKDKAYFGIFHEQGLGKTKIAVDLALYWLEQEICESVVFVTKKNLVRNWQSEVKEHTNIYPVLFSATKKENAAYFNSPAYLFICHYDLIKNDLENFKTFCQMRKVGMILDESVAIKNPTSQVSKAFHNLSKFLVRKIIMTGTPVDNRPYDVWSQVYFLDGGESLGRSFTSFKEKYDLKKDLNTNALAKIKFENDLLLLKSKLKNISVRETKDTAKLDLPEKTFHRVEVEMDDAQRAIYEKVKNEVELEIVKDGKPKLEDFEFLAVRLLRLIQVSSDPSIFDESYKSMPPKFRALKEIVEETSEEEKIIIWTNYIKTSENLAKRLESYEPLLLNGNIDTEERNRRINQFKTSSKKILIATIGSAKEGLTLTVANHAVFFERNFSLADYLQAQDRIHRISQNKEAHIYNIFTKNSVEEWIEALVQAKESAASFVQGDIDSESFADKIRYDFDEILHNVLNRNEF